MKLQISILLVIIVLVTFIYYTSGEKVEGDGGDQLLGSAYSLNKMKFAWIRIYGLKAKMPGRSIFDNWYESLLLWQQFNNTTKLPSKTFDVRGWAGTKKRQYREVWKKAYGSKNLPMQSKTLFLWYDALVKWQTVNKTQRYPSSKIDLLKWEVDYDRQQKAAKDKAAREKAARDKAARDRAARDKAAREAAAKKAKDPCEWVKQLKKE